MSRTLGSPNGPKYCLLVPKLRGHILPLELAPTCIVLALVGTIVWSLYDPILGHMLAHESNLEPYGGSNSLHMAYHDAMRRCDRRSRPEWPYGPGKFLCSTYSWSCNGAGHCLFKSCFGNSVGQSRAGAAAGDGTQSFGPKRTLNSAGHASEFQSLWYPTTGLIQPPQPI